MNDGSGQSLQVKAALKHHQLHAIRMNWLRWLSQPIIFIWNFIADSFLSVWKYLILTSWNAMRESLNFRYWIISGIGIFLSSFIILIFIFAGLKFAFPVLSFIGILLGILPVAWANSEIAAALVLKDTSGSEPSLAEIKQGMGTGLKSLMLLFIFVAIILITAVLEVVLNLAGLVPHAGFILLGILIVPLLLLSAIIFLAGAIILFGTPMIGSHILSHDESHRSFFGRIFYTALSLIQVIFKKWLDLILISVPAAVLALLVTIIPAVILAGSASVTNLLATGTLSFFETSFEPLNNLMMMASPESGFLSYIAAFFWGLSLAVISAFLFSFPHSSFACTYHRLYSHTASINPIKKILGLLIICLLCGIVFFLLSGIFGYIISLIDFFPFSSAE